MSVTSKDSQYVTSEYCNRYYDRNRARFYSKCVKRRNTGKTYQNGKPIMRSFLIRMYGSADAGHYLRNAATGVVHDVVIGSKFEELFFKVIDVSAGKKLTLFYDSPEEYERHQKHSLMVYGEDEEGEWQMDPFRAKWDANATTRDRLWGLYDEQRKVKAKLTAAKMEAESKYLDRDGKRNVHLPVNQVLLSASVLAHTSSSSMYLDLSDDESAM